MVSELIFCGWFSLDGCQFNIYNFNFSVQAHIPYAYGDPYVNGLYTAYGPQVTVSAC